MYSEIAPFKGCGEAPASCSCDYLKLCWQEKGATELHDCSTVAYEEKHSAVSGQFESEISVVAECYEGLVQPTSGETTLEGPLARGQSCPVLPDTAGETEAVSIYMLPIRVFGPTYDPLGGVITSTLAKRWGATSAELLDGSILMAGGAALAEGCTDWADPNCVGQVVSTAEVYNPGTPLVQIPTTGRFYSANTDDSQRMTEPRTFAAAVTLPSGEVAIFGGFTGANTPSKTVDIYSPTERSFVAGPPMDHTRAHHTATLISSEGTGSVLLVGGFGSGGDTWELWIPEAGTWASGQLNAPRWHHTSTRVNKVLDAAAREMVIITGGEGGTPISVQDTMEIFDIETRTFDAEPAMLCSNGTEGSPAPVGKTMHAAAFLPERHVIYIAGGFSDVEHLNPVRVVCAWHTIDEKWQAEAGQFMLEKGRAALSATALPGNEVLLAGGLTESGGELEIVDNVEVIFEYLNEKSETVVDIGPGEGFPINMLTPRWNHGAIVGCDGKVLFYGGLGGFPSAPVPLKDTEVFNPQ